MSSALITISAPIKKKRKETPYAGESLFLQGGKICHVFYVLRAVI
jgi:hypothetical protein